MELDLKYVDRPYTDEELDAMIEEMFQVQEIPEDFVLEVANANS